MAALPTKCENKTWQELLKIQGKMAKFMFAMRYVGRIKTPQIKIAKVIGTTFQQVQKVEKTENGMSADKFFLGMFLAADKIADWIIHILFGSNNCKCNLNNGSGNRCKRCGCLRKK